MKDDWIITMGQRLTLQARDPGRNIARQYSILLQPDLYGAITVDYRWGRIGTTGHCRRRAFADVAQAEQFARTLLVRRGGARRRIGVAYQAC